MTRSTKQIALNLIAGIVSFVVSLGISFLIVPFVVEKIGREAYGFVGLANNFTQYAGILTAALNSMAGRFITVSLSRGEKEEAQKYISSVFFANLILAVPISIMGGLIIVNLNNILDIEETLLPSVQILWGFIFGGFILSLVTNVFTCATFAKNRLDLSSIVNIGISIMRAAILLTAFLCFKPLIWYIGLSNFTATIISVLAAFILFKKLMPETVIRMQYVEIKKITTLVSSGIWNSISQLSSIVLEELDLLIANIFINAGAMGLVSIAKSVPTKLLSFFVLFGNAFSPRLTIDYAQGDFEAVKKSIISAARLISFCSSVPLVCIYVLGRDFFRLWIPGQDAEQLYIIAVLACMEFPLVIPGEPLWKVFTAANKTKQTAAVAIVTAVISASLTFGLLSIANTDFQKMCIVVGVSSFLGLFRGSVFLPLYGAHCIHMKWYTFYPVLGKSLLGLLLGSFITVILRQFVTIDNWFDLIMVVFFSGMITMVIHYFLLLRIDERVILRNKISRMVAHTVNKL